MLLLALHPLPLLPCGDTSCFPEQKEDNVTHWAEFCWHRSAVYPWVEGCASLVSVAPGLGELLWAPGCVRGPGGGQWDKQLGNRGSV